MRTTIKLKKKIRKNNIKKNRKSRKMIGGGEKREYSESDKFNKRSTRSSGQSFEIVQRVLGNIFDLTNANYPYKEFTQEQIDTFVDNLTDGPQVISLPTPPDSHSIFVNIIMEHGKKTVMISDWNGEAPRFLGKTQPKNKKEAIEQWKYYTMLIQALEQKYGIKNVKYYPKDETLAAEADDKNTKCNNQGGCSEYMYKWIEHKIIPTGYMPIYSQIETPY
jgi:hypothetical protein